MGDLVEVKKLNSFFDEEGELFETLRSDDSFFRGGFGQNLVSLINPGVIKGFHKHEKQVEYTTCLRGEIVYIALKENFEDPESPSIQKFIINKGNRILIRTPPEIWHGYKVLGSEEAVVLYTMNRPYDKKNPDTEDMNPLRFGDIWNLD